MHHRRGLSLIECIVAAAFLTAGLLAVAGLARSGGRLALLGSRAARAVEIAASRLARLEAAGCAAAAGSLAQPPFSERWSVASGPGLRAAEVEVSFSDGERVRHVRVALEFGCPAP